MTVILNALKETQNANILSTPSILTLDNQEAFITVGQNVPFVTGSFTNTGSGGDGAQNPFQTIERENVGITLTVTPHVNDGDAVVLDISQEVSSLSGLSVAASDLITNERKIQTKVLAVDGKIVVLGGLIKDDVQNAQQKVPILGDIPFLGRLFRSDAEKVTKQNLMIFIRPTIIRDDRALAGATAEKYRYIRDQQSRRKEGGLMYLDDADLPHLAREARNLGKDHVDHVFNGQPVALSAAEILQIEQDINSQTYARDFMLIDQSHMIISFIPTLADGRASISSGVERELQHAHEGGKEVYVIWTAKMNPSVFVTQTATRVFRSTHEAIAYFGKKGYTES